MTPALPRWWREPWWARVTLAAILVAFSILTLWNLARGGDFAFYEASVRSMSQSWQALFFGAFDPAATVTLDKLSGFAVPQALSVRLFGMSTSALALPQVVEGLITVFACALIGLRWRGRVTGLVAAGAAASTPIFVSMFAHPMEDGLVTMALAVAVVWWQRAILTRRVWPLLMVGLFIGVGFQAKMMQAWFVLPALVIGTLMAVDGGWLRRLRSGGVLLGSAVAASLSWMLAMQLVPARSRPFVDGSTKDDLFAMVFGYNGIDRVVPNAVAGAVRGGAGTSASGPAAAVTKLVDPTYVGQIGWLYPAAVFGLVLGGVLAVRAWRRRRAAGGTVAAILCSPAAATYVVVALWLVTGVVVLSAAHMPHTAYLSAIGVQLALLSGFAVSEAVRLRAEPGRWAHLALPALALVQLAWVVWVSLVARTPPVLRITMLVVAAAMCVVVVIAIVPAAARRLGVAVTVAAAVAVVAGPAIYSAQVVDAARDGSGGDAYVGIKPGVVTASHGFTPSPPQVWGGAPSMTPSLVELLKAVRAAGGGADGAPLFLTDAWSIAAPIINATGEEVLTDGGYSGQAVVFSSAQIRARIASGLHLIVLKDHAPSNDPVAAVVKGGSCRTLHTWPSTAPNAHGSSSATAKDGAGGFTLYACS